MITKFDESEYAVAYKNRKPYQWFKVISIGKIYVTLMPIGEKLVYIEGNVYSFHGDELPYEGQRKTIKRKIRQKWTQCCSYKPEYEELFIYPFPKDRYIYIGTKS